MRKYEPIQYSVEYYNKCGVYQIRNIVNGRVYIGSSKTLGRRKTQHFSDLKNQRHANKILQRSYNKYGHDKLIFEIIELCNLDERIDLEQYWLNELRKKNKICNHCDTVTHPNPRYGKDNNKSTAVICLETKKVYVSLTEASADTNINRGIIGEQCIGKIAGKKSSIHWMYYSDYIKATEDEINQRMEHTPRSRAVICLDTLQIFKSISEASKVLGIRKGNIHLCCKKERNNAKNHHFAFLEDYKSMSSEEIQSILNYKAIPSGSQKVYCKETNKVYPSLTDAMRNTGIDRHQIADCCKNLRDTTACGMHFKYVA